MDEGAGDVTTAPLKHACVDSGQYGLNVSSTEYVDQGVRLLRTTDLSRGSVAEGGVFIDGPIESRFLVQAGDLLLSRSGTIGQAYLASPPDAGCSFAGYLIRFRPRESTDPRFLYYTTQSQTFQEQIAAEAVVSTIANFNADRYANVAIPLPAIEDQRTIADFLDDQIARIDNIIASRRRQRELVDEAAATTVRDGVAGALPGTSTTLTNVPWIGRISTSGEVRALARILTLQRGVDLTADQQRPNSVPVVTTGGIVGFHDTSIVRGPGVVVGRYGTAGAVYWVDEDFWPHNTTLYVKEYFGNDRRWCYYLLSSYPYEMLQARSAVPGVNRNDMAPDPMPWIPLDLQRAAVAYLDLYVIEARRRAESLAESARLLEELKRSLITAAVTGEFDVSSADGSRVPA